MLEDAAGIRRVMIACGYVDLRKGIDSLSMIIGDRYHQNPFEKGTLFLFCGRRSDRIKGLLWMGDDFLQLYKRLEAGSLSWPRTSEEDIAKTCVESNACRYSYFKKLLKNEQNNLSESSVYKLPEHSNLRGKEEYQ